MKLKKIAILALFLSLVLIGSVSATTVTNDSPTQGDINQTSADSDLLAKTENPISNTSSDEGQQDMNFIDDNGNEIKEMDAKLATENRDKSSDEFQTSNPIAVNDYSQLYSQIANLKNQGTSRAYVINLNQRG